MNQITNHKEFASGDFHIADVYVVNHDADNVIEFTPRHSGIFKILLKQPEKEIAADAAESMLLEIGVARADGDGKMKSAGNHLVHLEHGEVELDFSVMEF